ncbi:uncharacterized protein OCT59_013534 [Rhizophagus irregularis]|uniref:uncharacterized protein n=1 Tax=Rhizophagus irregularis TaxID=588596 RepID=UPI003326FEE5|nr:hypothetical protein OCT59_013534 [Rhizophagus irregularis]
MRLKQQIVNQEQHTRAHIINPTSRHDIATIEPLFRNCCHLISTKLYLIIPYSRDQQDGMRFNLFPPKLLRINHHMQATDRRKS